jgi:hypothetical protein
VRGVDEHSAGEAHGGGSPAETQEAGTGLARASAQRAARSTMRRYKGTRSCVLGERRRGRKEKEGGGGGLIWGKTLR